MIRSHSKPRSLVLRGTLRVWIGLWGAFANLGANAQPVPATLAAVAVLPAPGARDVCPDTPLRITFSDVPQRGGGKIQVVDLANDAVVETIDLATPTGTRTIGGLASFTVYPIIISGNQAIVFLSSNALGYNKNYEVKVDAGAFKDSLGNPWAGGPGVVPWRFTTRTAPPAAGSRRLTVAADGSGDFATVQGALDFVPEGNTAATTIFIRSGTYHEIVCFTGKNAITLLGEDRKKTVIAYANNARFSGNAGGNPFAAGAVPPGAANPRRGGAVYRRGLLLAHRVDDLVIANLTLRNTTPQGGTQAEAIILNGTANARAIVTSVDLFSYQDTLQINGQAYISDCSIEGDVDFMWGTGPCFFEGCTARTLRSNAYYTQIRNPATHHGYVYKDCTFAGAPGVTGNVLSRIAPARFPASEVVLIDCVMTDAVGPVAWRLDQATEAPRVHFWEYRSHDADGKPRDTSRRLAVSRQLTLPDDSETIAAYSDPKYVLGGNWSPALAPIIATQPAAVAVAAGRKATFGVTVAAVPKATYQWQKDGEDLVGATSATYAIAVAGPSHAGTYTVIARNSAGTVSSEPARLSLEDREAKWTRQESGTRARLRGLSVVSEEVAWASGTEATCLRTTNGGKTWDARLVPGAAGLDFRDVHGVDASTAYLLSIGAGDRSRIYKTIDGGATWTLSFTNRDRHGFLDAVAFWDGARGLALGDPVEGRFVILATDDGGQSWTRIAPDGLPPALPGEGAFAASGTCLVVGANGRAWFGTGGAKLARVFRSTDRGRTWTVAETPLRSGSPSAGIFSLAFWSADDGVAVGGDYKQPEEAGGTAARSSDGGRTWIPVTERTPAGYRSAVAVLPGAVGPTLVAVGPGGTDRSSDGGAGWHPLGADGFDATVFVSPHAGWAVGEDGRIAKFAADR